MTDSHHPCPPPVVRTLGLTGYADAVAMMQAHTAARGAGDPDEIWLTYHAATYTLGQSGKREHVLDAGDIPVVRTNRGGQVTYHGPGQVVAYVLIDLRRATFGIRTLVRKLEQALIDTLAAHGITAARLPRRPGVYVGNAKLGAIGLRVSRGCTYHGVSLNVSCDLSPFAGINTCGYADLADTSMRELGCAAKPARIAAGLGDALVGCLARPAS